MNHFKGVFPSFWRLELFAVNGRWATWTHPSSRQDGIYVAPEEAGYGWRDQTRDLSGLLFSFSCAAWIILALSKYIL